MLQMLVSGMRKMMNGWLNSHLMAVIALAFFGLGSAHAVPSTTGLVAYYPFDVDALDASGNNNNGLINGGVSFVTGAVGKGAKFNGINSAGGGQNPDYIRVPNSSSLQFTNAMTVSYWARIDGNRFQTGADCSGAAESGIAGTVLGKSGDRNGFLFTEYDKDSSFSINPWSGGLGVSSPAGSLSSAYGAFRHVTYTVNGSTASLYVNGVLVASATGTVNFSSSNTQDMYIGTSNNRGGACLDFWGQFDGVIDELRIYNRVLSGSEIQELFSAATPASGTAPTDMVAYYCFDDPANIGKDCSANGNNGTASGGVSAVSGVQGGGALFGGYNNPGSIHVPNSASLQFGTTSSLSYFVKIDNPEGMDGWGSFAPNGWNGVVAKSHDRTGLVWNTGIDTTNQLLAGFGGFSGVTVTAGTDVLNGWATGATGRWVHVAHVVDNVGLKTYLDGQLAWSQNGSVNFGVANTQDLYVGKFSDSWYPLNGTLDDLKIFNRALSAGEVQQLFSGMASGVVVPVCTLTASPTSITAGGSSTLTASCTPAATSYSWSGGSCAGNTSNTCTASPAATTAYTVAGVNASGSGTAASVTVTVTGAQTISFPAYTPTVAIGGSGTVSATATSGLPVTYSNNTPSICSVSSTGTVTGISAGTCIIAANQAGNASYSAATQVTQAIVVTALLDQSGTGSSAYVPIAEKLYVSYFGRPADPAGLANMEAQFAAAGAPTTAQAFVDAYATNATVKAVIDSFGNSQESKNLYGTGSTQTFVTAIFTYLLNRSPLDAGLTYWSNAIDSGAMSRGQAAMNILVGAENNTSTQGLIDAARLANVVTISANFTHSINTPEEVAGYAGQVAAGKARTMLATVTNTTDPVVFQDTVDTTIVGMGVATTCGSFTLGSTSSSVSADGGTGSLSVTGTSGCAWTASSSASWITVTSGASGSGNGSVGYSVAANTGTGARSGTVTVDGQTFTVSQDAPAAICGAVTISPASNTISSAGGTGSVSVTASSGCPWTASSNASWITVTSGASGSGNGSVSYSVAANTGTGARSGTVTVGGQTFTVSQDAATATCDPAVSKACQ